jgi:phosphoribosylformimino-5-aminoimidazole carboxamide ribotide isomerase
MNIYPAIDLRHGRVVRLKYGDPNQQTTYSDDPIETAQRWAEAGASWIHVVNLDGALGDAAGAALNRSLLQSLETVGPKIQFGGGLRSISDVEAALSLGIARVVIGTLAIERPEVLRQAVEQFGSGRVVVGLDARGTSEDTRLAGDGGIDIVAIGRQMRSAGVNLVVHGHPGVTVIYRA